ncbi:MAG: ArnT family glycosyltransferase [bacterium]
MAESDRSQLFSPSSMRTGLALAGVFLFAFWLRVDGYRWGLPFRLHPDEWKYVSAAAECHRGQWNPKYFRNPPGFSYLTAAWYPLWLPFRSPVEIPAWLNIDPLWLKPSRNVEATYLYRPFDLAAGARVLSALLGALTAVAVFFLAREVLPAHFALGAASLAAISFANVRESHFAVNDPAMAFFTTTVLVLGLLWHRCGRLWLLGAAAACGGVAVAVKYNAFPAVLSLLILRASCYWPRKNEESLRILARDLLLLVALSVFFFLVVCPFPLIDTPTFLHEMTLLREAAAQPWAGQDTRWSLIQFLEAAWISEGALAMVLAAIGLAAALRERKGILLVFPGLYGILVAVHPLFFVRFSLPVLPWISLFAAYGVSVPVTRLIRKERMGLWITVALFLTAGTEPLLKDRRSNFLLKQTDTRIECLRWFLTEERSPVLIGTDQFAVPLVYRGIADVWTKPLDPRMVSIDGLPSGQLQQLDTLAQVPAGYLVYSNFAPFTARYPDTGEERRAAIQKFVGHNRPDRVFQPFTRPWTPQPADVEDTYSPFRNLWGRDRPGAVIEVYKRETVGRAPETPP